MQRIIVEDVYKEFSIGFRKDQSALGRFVSLLSAIEPKRTIKALDGVSFEVEKGQILGVIGENGSGKSTLLRVIAGVYTQDRGRVAVSGNLISLINLYIGLRDRLTMEDNIYLVGALFGMSQKAVKERFNAIVEFSELKDFVDTKIYQFSNGMMERLVFSVAVNCDPEILLLDEVFEVGDEHFRLKSADELKKLIKNGASIVMVSHEMWMVEKHCDRAIWLDKGRIFKAGKAEDVVSAYKRSVLK
jgi:ABC-type polysaccharide/polyol phosphate transport system ATPase subunit